MTLEHEEIHVVQGRRTALPVIIAVHSTKLGAAAGGCRMWSYTDWRDGMTDACRLAETMTYKFALAGLPLGGGKSVIALPPGYQHTASSRRDVMLDLGDAVEALAGRYGVGEDVGTTAEDMAVVRQRTEHAYCLPTHQGGIGEPSEPTARGVFDCIRQLAIWLGQPRLDGYTFCVVGLGQVGGRLARLLHAEGARLVVSDVDDSKQAMAEELDADWVDASVALTTPCDVLVPAALGGFLTTGLVPQLRCRAIVGPANSQLVDEDVAELLAQRGIIWGPDYLVNAGGAVYAGTRDILGGDESTALARLDAVGATFADVLARSDREERTPHAVARQLARERLGVL